ncbi:helix-turn-helix domain-containing protein [Paenibacillus illinoisensis]|uniref:helix-turn-helix domain-containing protein n=1 Tax=Paenibacillus illinoisensis TaxID=59845 RepID=UPI00158112C6|nr:helix-turn-helix transcriptional regulator [Paenibacillus illinoisensis]
MQLSEKITKIMEEKDLTAYRVSKDTGIPYTTLTKILNGTTKSPKIDLIQIIAKYLDVTVDSLTTPESNNVQAAPDWATAKDMRDFKKMLEEDEPIMFDGVPISEEDKEKVKRVMEAMFWDAKKENKKTYGRKKKEE